jgi:S-formylglutathione hydrolase
MSITVQQIPGLRAVRHGKSGLASVVLLPLLLLVTQTVWAYEKIFGQIDSDWVPGPVEYALIAPDGFADMRELPLVLNLHGGGGDRTRLLAQANLWQRLWSSDTIPPAVVVMPSVTPRGFYMNFKDGSERWEDFLTGPFLEHLHKTYPVTSNPKRVFVTGVSMGGMGALRMAFRYPAKFGAVAALEPGIEPILAFADMQAKHRFWRNDDLLHAAFGKPVDEAYWAANNPATMAVNFADNIRTSGLQIYVEAGDEDQFWLYEGAEFLHRILWDQRIKHEYHLVRGADHVGPSMGERLEEAVLFLFRYHKPWGVTLRTERRTERRLKLINKMLDPLKARIDGTDHYSEEPAP